MIIRRIILSLLAFAAVLSSSACGQKGSDGTAYLAVTWSNALIYYMDTNPSIPTASIVKGNYYKTEPGTYHYSYGICNGIYNGVSCDGTVPAYEGDYTISIQQGEDGGFLKSNGSQGKDTYFSLWLMVNGPQAFVHSQSIESASSAETISKSSSTPASPSNGTLETSVVSSGSASFTLKSRKTE